MFGLFSFSLLKIKPIEAGERANERAELVIEIQSAGSDVFADAVVQKHSVALGNSDWEKRFLIFFSSLCVCVYVHGSGAQRSTVCGGRKENKK